MSVLRVPHLLQKKSLQQQLRAEVMRKEEEKGHHEAEPERGKSYLGQQLVPSPSRLLEPTSSSREDRGYIWPSQAHHQTSPSLLELAGATSEQHQHHPHRPSLEEGLLLLPAWFVVMLATAALLDSRLRSETPLTASTQKE